MPPPPQLPSDHATPRPRPRPPPPAGESSVPVHAAKRAPPPPAPAAAAKKMARPASAPDLTALPAAARPRPRPALDAGQERRPGQGREREAGVHERRAAPRPCRILLWLRARVVSSPDAYHCTIKYAADLSDMFAGKIVNKPADHVRLAPRPTTAKPAKPMAPALEAKEEASSLPRR
ncbi:unnamed protein product [Miscanthus lutarioriparius]|uniref:Uncharacterized protein n=1 Tax=Miscanthus lutarioriparius TaxID=422564 RepID=A0A811S322_9POAL|nr:unnamed protein product [Miscanthus lutarioriparius]